MVRFLSIFTAAMLLTQAGCVFMGFILHISGVSGQAMSICALKGSSVDLFCPAENPTSSMNWYTVQWNYSKFFLDELSADENVRYNMSEEGHFKIKIEVLGESDAKFYCCKETTEDAQLCWQNRIELHVADLQVKVIPVTEKQTVTLICSTSCHLTETPAAYIWFKNGDFLYEDWSPWYQEVVHGEVQVRYSCAIKGYKNLRAPEVSVDSVTSTCFSVTYNKGKMCSYYHKSEDEPCSITYPREIRIQKKQVKNYLTMTCSSSCPAADSQIFYEWYWNEELYTKCESPHITVLSPSHNSVVSCNVQGHKDLPGDKICPDDDHCSVSNYVRHRICALEGFSVNISSQVSRNSLSVNRLWYKIERPGEGNVENLAEDPGHVAHDDSMKKLHVLRITNLRRNDSGVYIFRSQIFERSKYSALSGVTLVVTDLEVRMTPSAVVTEGQRVTLTCGTSCPLPENTTYSWYMDSQPLTQPGKQGKHMVLDPVSTHHAGKYSCAVITPHNISSSEKALNVIALEETVLIMNTIKLILLFLVLPTSFLLQLWMRKKKISTNEPSDRAQSGPD